MEAVVLAAALALSVVIAAGVAYGSLTLAMYLIDVGTEWTTAPADTRRVPSRSWTDALPDAAATTKQPIAA